MPSAPPRPAKPAPPPARGSHLRGSLFRCALLLLPVLSACNAPSSVRILQAPPASMGGGETTGIIRGQVTGPTDGRRILIYALAGSRWWVQPYASAPFTRIQPDGSWQANIHLGTAYAALLSSDTGMPPTLLEELPSVNKTLLAVTSVQASGPASIPPEQRHPPVIRFSGLDWEVRAVPGDYTARTNDYSPANVSVDASGALHMALRRQSGAWVCSEIHTLRALGYGDYRIDVRDVGRFEPAVMFSVFTRVEAPADGDHRQMSVHVTQRGDPTNTNAEFIVQPYFVPANFYHFNVPPGPATMRLQWSPDNARFSMSSGSPTTSPKSTKPATEQAPIRSWVFTTGVPTPDDAQLYINFCNYGYAHVPPTHDAEIVVNRFEFYP